MTGRSTSSYWLESVLTLFKWFRWLIEWQIRHKERLSDTPEIVGDDQKRLVIETGCYFSKSKKETKKKSYKKLTRFVRSLAPSFVRPFHSSYSRHTHVLRRYATQTFRLIVRVSTRKFAISVPYVDYCYYYYLFLLKISHEWLWHGLCHNHNLVAVCCICKIVRTIDKLKLWIIYLSDLLVYSLSFSLFPFTHNLMLRLCVGSTPHRSTTTIIVWLQWPQQRLVHV